MKARFPALGALLLLCGVFASNAFAQIVVQSIDIVSEQYQVKTKFTFAVDPTTNTLTVAVDNTYIGDNNAKGTVTSFGFNTPFTDAQLGDNGSNVSFTQVFTQKLPGHNPDKWQKFEPYQISQNGGYSTDLGVGTGNTPTGGSAKDGIKFGEKATFTFTFQDFTPEQVIGFFDQPSDVIVRWQEVRNNSTSGQSDYGWAGFPDELPPTPEPSTYGLMGAAALVGLAVFRRRQQKRKAEAAS